MIKLSHPYMTTEKTIALTRWTFVSKVMSLLFNMLPRFLIAFLPRSKRLLISLLQSPSAVILEPKKIKSVTVSIVSPSICHEVINYCYLFFIASYKWNHVLLRTLWNLLTFTQCSIFEIHLCCCMHRYSVSFYWWVTCYAIIYHYLFIHHFWMDIWIIFIFWPIRIKLLWTFMCKSMWISFLLSKNVGVEFLKCTLYT